MHPTGHDGSMADDDDHGDVAMSWCIDDVELMLQIIYRVKSEL